MNLFYDTRAETTYISATGHLETMMDIVDGFIKGQCVYTIANSDTLMQLLEVILIKFLFKFKLTDQDNLEQLCLIRLQVGKQTKFFECFFRYFLGFVNNNDGSDILFSRFQQDILKGTQ